MIIRDEVPKDIEAIRLIVTAAFESAPHKSGSEAAIIEALRTQGALTLSLVAEEEGDVLGYVAYSPVSIDGHHAGWFGLGPIAVIDRVQRRGIGTALVEFGIRRLAAMGARGCVVLGNPAYYGRFGFESDASLRLPGVPERSFQRLLLSGQAPTGLVEYHTAFY